MAYSPVCSDAFLWRLMSNVYGALVCTGRRLREPGLAVTTHYNYYHHPHHNHMPRRRCITTLALPLLCHYHTQRHISFHYNSCFPISVRSMRIRITCKTPSPPSPPPPWICFSQVQRNLISLDLDCTGFEAPQTPADAHDARPLPSPNTR